METKNNIEEVFSKYVPLVYKIISRLNYEGYEKEDLIQAGLMGLYEASKKFQEEKKNSFLKYATIYILSSIKSEIRSNQKIIISKDLYKIIKEIKSYERNCSITNIATKFNCNKEKILLAILYKERILSLNETHEDSELIEIIPSPKKNIDVEMIKSLDDISKKIIILKYYHNLSQQKIASFLNFSQSKISRIEKRALEKIRKNL